MSSFNVWRVILKPNDKNDNDFKMYCINNGYTVMGWRAEETFSAAEKDKYIQLCKKFWNNGYERACNYYFEMKKDDLCLTRDSDGIYYIGKIIDTEPAYADDEILVEHGTSWLRKVEWHKVGKQDSMPASIVAWLSQRQQSTISKRNSEDIKALCKLVFNDVADKYYKVDTKCELTENNFANCLSYEQLEDLVGLYLQKNKGLLFYPSSCHKTTQNFEYILVDPSSLKKVYVQVKQQQEIDAKAFSEKYKDSIVYLFSNLGYINASKDEHINCIDKKSLYEYFKENLYLFQDSLKYEKMLYKF